MSVRMLNLEGIRADRTGTDLGLQPFVKRPETKLPPVCPKCGSHRTRIVGQSGKPPIVHYRCEDCGHVFSRARDDE